MEYFSFVLLCIYFRKKKILFKFQVMFISVACDVYMLYKCDDQVGFSHQSRVNLSSNILSKAMPHTDLIYFHFYDSVIDLKK